MGWDFGLLHRDVLWIISKLLCVKYKPMETADFQDVPIFISFQSRTWRHISYQFVFSSGAMTHEPVVYRWIYNKQPAQTKYILLKAFLDKILEVSRAKSPFSYLPSIQKKGVLWSGVNCVELDILSILFFTDN
jgi:hypothetical protein